jgi:hypothetical protein
MGIGAGAVALALVVLAGACGGSGSNAGGDSGNKPSGTFGNPLEQEGEPQRGGKLIVAVPAETNGWNPIVNQWPDAGSLVGSSFLEPLTILDPQGVPQPWLAEKWSSNADFTQWEVTIRPNVKFHDGEPLDSAAVKKNIDAMYQGGLTKVALESQYDHVEVTGPLSVKVFLKHPWSQWPASGQNIWMMAPKMLDRPDQGVRVHGPLRVAERVEPGGHRRLHLPGLAAGQVAQGHEEPELLAQGRPGPAAPVPRRDGVPSPHRRRRQGPGAQRERRRPGARHLGAARLAGRGQVRRDQGLHQRAHVHHVEHRDR